MPETILSILIISYNTREMTLECIRSVFDNTTRTPFEIIVFDNASVDGSADAITQEFGDRVQIICSPGNIGFAAGNNAAAEHARGEYLLLLNPDTVVLEGSIDTLMGFAEQRPEAKIWGGRTFFADGTLNATNCFRQMSLWSLTCRAFGLTALFSNSEFFNPECYGRWLRDRERAVGVVTGCFLLIRREFWEQLGGFDKTFFMYAEEADLCLRASRLGARPTVTPDATIIHHGGASEPDRAEKVIKVFRGKATLMRCHWSVIGRSVGILLMAWTAFTRDLLYSIVGLATRDKGRTEMARLWRKVWTRTPEWARGYPS